MQCMYVCANQDYVFHLYIPLWYVVIYSTGELSLRSHV